MKPLSIFKMTAFENYRGQVIWIGFSVGLFTLIMIALLSEAAMSHQTRLVDVASYFVVDMVSFITATYIGSQIYNKDFSNRGIAEIAIPNGVNRVSLLIWRLLSHTFCLFGFVAFLLGCRMFSFYIAGQNPPNVLQTTFYMFCFVSFKAVLALSIAVLFSCLSRPIISLLGTVALFVVGHFSTGINAVQGLVADNNQLSQMERILFKALKIWNPNLLVLESFQGAWETISLNEMLGRLTWGISAFCIFTCLALLAVRKRDIGALVI